jgi:hypothetical protein
MLAILLGILIVVIVYLNYQQEGFETSITIPVYDLWNNYVIFHTEFYKIWNTSLITSYSINQPRDPSVSTPPIPTNDQLNTFVKKLGMDKEKEFPPGANPLEEIKSFKDKTLSALKEIEQYDDNLRIMIKYVPEDASIFINAYDWMNNALEESHKSMKAALSGKSVDGFDTIADQLAKCDQLKKTEDGKTRAQNEIELIKRITKIMNDEILQNAIKRNKELVDKSKKIKSDAESGALVGAFNTPDSSNTFVVPDAKLDKLKREDPKSYNNYKQNYKQLFDIQSMNEQINASLR